MPQTDLRSFIASASRNGKKLLSIYLTCGFPRKDWTLELADAAFENGADFIELGMPFSDPLADGPAIQAASHAALNTGVTTADVLRTASQLSSKCHVLYMGYMNNLLAKYSKEFLSSAFDAGISGFIIPDWPINSASDETLEKQFELHSMPRIPFVTPTSTDQRIQMIDRLNAPFIYAVSVAGVTGARKDISEETLNYLRRLRGRLQTPFLVGFGVSTPENARAAAHYCDGVIIGSAFINGIASAASQKDAIKFVGDFVGSVREALDNSRAKNMEID